MERASSEKWRCSFEREQLLFEVDSAGVSGKRSVVPEHTVTRDYDCNMVLMIRHTDSA